MPPPPSRWDTLGRSPPTNIRSAKSASAMSRTWRCRMSRRRDLPALVEGARQGPGPGDARNVNLVSDNHRLPGAGFTASLANARTRIPDRGRRLTRRFANHDTAKPDRPAATSIFSRLHQRLRPSPWSAIIGILRRPRRNGEEVYQDHDRRPRRRECPLASGHLIGAPACLTAGSRRRDRGYCRSLSLALRAAARTSCLSITVKRPRRRNHSGERVFIATRLRPRKNQHRRRLRPTLPTAQKLPAEGDVAGFRRARFPFPREFPTAFPAAPGKKPR